MSGDLCVFGIVTTNKPGYGHHLEKLIKREETERTKSACPVNMVKRDYH